MSTKKNIAKYGCLPIALLVGIALALSGGEDDTTANSDLNTKPSKPAATKSAADDDTPGLDTRQITRLSVDMVWDSYNESRRDILCAGIEVNGPGWFADQMQSDNIDPDYAAELVSEKCESR